MSRTKKNQNQTSNDGWENKTSGKTQSPWFAEIPQLLKLQKLNRNISVDVVIVGGGIAGMLISCFSFRYSFHGLPAFLIVAGTFNRLKSVGKIDDKSFQCTGIDTVAEALVWLKKLKL